MSVMRVICDPPECSKCDTTILHIQSRYQYKIFLDNGEKYISNSFLPLLREMIPREGMTLGFGGYWFWNSYLHALCGEDLLLDLSGSGISLSEDSLDTQASLRKKFFMKDTKREKLITDYCSAKIEAICSICLSIVLHVARQPMLEDNQGPHALILCATKDQCDEIYSLVDRMASAFHLVTHNLFGGYPSMPAQRKADIVVGTLPLWEGVANIDPLGIQKGLEEILYQVSGDSRLTSSSTRCRPYALDYVTQLFFVDLDLQNALGYLPMLQRVVIHHRKQGANKNMMKTSVLPQGCQLYSLNIGENGAEIFKKLRSTLQQSWTRENKTAAEMTSISFTTCTSGYKETKTMEFDRLRKRARTPFCLQEDAEKGEAEDIAVLQSKLVVFNALSHSRLLLDGSAFEDFSIEAKRRARHFWSRFETVSKPVIDSKRDIVDIQLAYGCRKLNDQNSEKKWYVRETVAILTPAREAVMHPTRTRLLMKYLDDELSGEVFDGSIVYCYNQCEDDLTVIKVDAVEVALHNLFEDTSNQFSQEAIFFSLEEPTGNVIESQQRRLCELRCQVVEASSTLTKGGGDFKFPLHKFLKEVSFYPKRSVLVFRRIARSTTVFCGGQNASKPLALLYLEECCQYGKVVSYFVHEQKLEIEKSSNDCVHFFVEFGTPEAAVEAARQFSLRLSGEVSPPPVEATPLVSRIKLFANDIYYEGVLTEFGKLSGTDKDKVDFFGVSLLDE